LKSTNPFLVLDESNFSITDLVDENEKYFKEVKTKDALLRARESGLDLVCFMAGNESHNFLCKLLDFGRWKYHNDKRRKKMKGNKSNRSELKEIRFTPAIGNHDVQHKVKHAMEFIESGHELLFTMRLRRRVSFDFAKSKMDEIIELCEGFASVTNRKDERNLITVKLEKIRSKK
jgi:translation initiation factor IF-3